VGEVLQLVGAGVGVAAVVRRGSVLAEVDGQAGVRVDRVPTMTFESPVPATLTPRPPLLAMTLPYWVPIRLAYAVPVMRMPLPRSDGGGVGGDADELPSTSCRTGEDDAVVGVAPIQLPQNDGMRRSRCCWRRRRFRRRWDGAAGVIVPFRPTTLAKTSAKPSMSIPTRCCRRPRCRCPRAVADGIAGAEARRGCRWCFEGPGEVALRSDVGAGDGDGVGGPGQVHAGGVAADHDAVRRLRSADRHRGDVVELDADRVRRGGRAVEGRADVQPPPSIRNCPG